MIHRPYLFWYANNAKCKNVLNMGSIYIPAMLYALCLLGWFTYVEVTPRCACCQLVRTCKYLLFIFIHHGDHVPGTLLIWLRTHHGEHFYAHDYILTAMHRRREKVSAYSSFYEVQSTGCCQHYYSNLKRLA